MKLRLLTTPGNFHNRVDEAELVVVNVYIYVNGRVRNGMVLFSIIFRLLAMFGSENLVMKNLKENAWVSKIWSWKIWRKIHGSENLVIKNLIGYGKFEGKCMERKYGGKRGRKYEENRKEKYIKIW